MVPDLRSLSRRQLLGSLAGGGGIAAGGTLAVGAKRPTALPDVLADWATNYYPTPPAPSSLWRPTVTEEHAREAVSLLAETDQKARELWEQTDYHERVFRGSGGWLDSAEESLADGNYADALSDARYGIQFAGEDLGTARAKLDQADLSRIADRSRELLDRIDAVVADLDGYPVADPERDLAWYVYVELELQRGRQLADWDGLEEVEDDDAESPFSENYNSKIGEITSQVLQAEIAVESAERYRDLLWENVEGADGYGGHLRRVADDLAAELESRPTRDEVESEYVGDDVDTYGPYEFAHSRLARWCFPASIPVPWVTTIDDEFLAARVLGLARGLIDWRAHDHAVDALELSPDDDAFDPGHVLAEKRRARSAYRSVVGSDPTPFAVVLSERAIGNIRTAEVDRSSWSGVSSWTPWHERVQAYLHALIGRSRLRQSPDVYELVVDR